MANMNGKPRPIGRVSMLAAALFGLAVSAGGTPARAETSWEQGCAMNRMPSGIPGNGTAILNFFCGQMNECQKMATQRGHMMMEDGCFYFAPKAATASAKTARR